MTEADFERIRAIVREEIAAEEAKATLSGSPAAIGICGHPFDPTCGMCLSMATGRQGLFGCKHNSGPAVFEPIETMQAPCGRVFDLECSRCRARSENWQGGPFYCRHASVSSGHAHVTPGHRHGERS